MIDVAGDACPDLESLETTPLAAAVRSHVESCPSCRLVVEVFADRPRLDDCERYDALLAARGDGTLNAAGKNLLERHLASCASCRAVAETLSPLHDTHGDHATLPKVDPAGYALGLEVARGGMGRVIAARDLRVGRPVAVKELLGRSPHLAARFEREARVTARLQHPGIVPIYEIGRWPDGTPFYSMRMVDGRTLLAAIERAATLPARLALLPAVNAAAEAVAFAHGQRVIHRDLTPSNVLVGAYGETVVIDWGLAKDLAHGTSDDDPIAGELATDRAELVGIDRAELVGIDGLTRAGGVVGTLAYMPPEQANAQPVDERSDVYALGAILYHLLSGAPPYRTRSTPELLEHVRTGTPPPPIDEIAPRSPRDLVSIVTKAMARSPSARYPSARELAEELVRFQTGRMVEAHQYSRGELMKRFVRRNRAAVTVTALAAIVLASVSAVYVSRILRSSERAETTARELVFERGRAELLAGNTLHALAYLWDSHQQGLRGRAIDFLLGSALFDLDTSETVFDCGGDVREFAFSPTTSIVAVACNDRSKLWDLETKALVHTLDGAPGDFDNLVYSHDGATLATWGTSGTVRVWDTRTGRVHATFEHRPEGARPGEHFDVTFTTFSPDNRRIATAGDDGYARIWDLATKTQAISIDVSSKSTLFRRVWGLYSHDGARILTTTLEGRSAAWDASTGKPLGGYEFGGFVSGGDESFDGKRVVQCGLDGLVKIRDATTTGELQHSIRGHTSVVWKCIFNADATRVLTASHDGTAKQWDVATGNPLTSVSHGDVVWRGHYSPDGRAFLTLGIAGQLKVWDTSGVLLATHDTHHGRGALFSRDSKRIVAMRGDGRIQVWHNRSIQQSSFAPEASILGTSQDGSLVFTVGPEPFSLVAWSARGERLRLDPGVTLETPFATTATRIAAKSGPGVVVIDTTGHTIARIPLRSRPDELQLSSDGSRLVASGAGTSQIFEVATGERVLEIPSANHALLDREGERAIAWSTSADPEEPVATGAEIWDLELGVRTLLLPSIDAVPIGFSHDGARVAMLERASQPSHDVSIWHVDSGAPVMPRVPAATAELDPSGRWLTTIGDGVTIYDMADGTVHGSFASDVGAVRKLVSAQASPDGELVAAVGDYGRAVVIMNGSDGRELARWGIAHDLPALTERAFAPPRSLVWWTPDGASVVSQSKTVAVWHAANRHNPDEIAAMVRRYVPWRIVNGRPQVVQNGKLSRRLTRSGVPLANHRLVVQISTAAEIGGASINWETTKAKFSKYERVTDEDGAFALQGLVPGDYSIVLTIGDKRHELAVNVSADDIPADLEIAR